MGMLRAQGRLLRAGVNPYSNPMRAVFAGPGIGYDQNRSTASRYNENMMTPALLDSLHSPFGRRGPEWVSERP